MARGAFLVVLVTGAACGRVAFDARSDAAADADPLAAHDEDGDGVFDPDDVCPHISDGDQADADGDRVGDVCDPNDASATERIVLFDPLVDPTVSLVFGGNVVPAFDGDSFRADTRNGEVFALVRGVVPGTDVFTMGGHIGETSVVNRRQLAMEAHESQLRFFYCEKYEHMAVTKWGLVWTPDYVNYFTLDAGNLTETLANHDFRTDLTTDPVRGGTCSTTFPVDVVLLEAAPTNVTPVEYQFYAQGMDVRIDYVIVIRTE